MFMDDLHKIHEQTGLSYREMSGLHEYPECDDLMKSYTKQMNVNDASLRYQMWKMMHSSLPIHSPI